MVSDASNAPVNRKGPRNRSGFGWEAATVALSRAFQKSTYFITSIILARLLGPEGRGLVSALLVPSQLAVNLSEMGIRQSTAFHLGRGIYPIDRLLPTLLTLIPVASTFAIAAALLYLSYAGIGQSDWLLLGLAVLAIPTSLTSSYASGVFLGRKRIAAFRSTSWRPALCRLILIIVLGWAIGLEVYGVMVANFAASALGAGYALYLLRREGKLRLGFDREVASSLQRRGLTYAASLFVLLLNYRIMILMLTRFSTLADVGIYAQAAVIAELIWEIPTAVSSLLISRSVNAKAEKAFSEKVLVLARLSFLAAVAFSLALAVLAPILLPILFGHRFAASASITIALLPGVVAFIVFKILSTDLSGRGKPWASMIIMLPVLMINILAGWWMIRNNGAWGAAVASSISYVIATILYIGLYSRMTSIRVKDMMRYRRSDFSLLFENIPLVRRKSS